jgi:HAD superfamily hydrolase (TIGR01509 family)
MLKAVIFDMDGVLVDSEPLHGKAHVLALKKRGIDITMDYCYSFVGSTTLHMIETIKKDFGINDTVTQLLDEYKKEKEQLIISEGHKAIPFTKELIVDLYNHGIKLAIASSSTMEEIEDVATDLGIKQYFHKLVSGTTVPNPKPAPDVFIKAMIEMGVSKNECIIIEDSCNGTVAGVSAGIPVLGYVNEHSGNQDLSKAFLLIEGFEEIDFKFIENTYKRANNIPITIAITKRLLIRELSVNDIPSMYEIYQNPEVKKYITDIDDYLENEIERHEAYVKNVYNFYGYGLWGIFSKDSDQLIGRCGIQHTIVNNREEIELGYLLDVNHWGFGYALECTKAVIDYAFSKLNMTRIIAIIDPLNERSIKVASRIGMEKESKIIKNTREYWLYSIEK